MSVRAAEGVALLLVVLTAFAFGVVAGAIAGADDAARAERRERRERIAASGCVEGLPSPDCPPLTDLVIEDRIPTCICR